MSSEESVWALGDTNRMKQVLWNLLNNAAQSMPEGGNIHVDVKALSNGSHPLVELTIQDEGVGIPTEDLDRVFHPFFTTKERGTGLGLAVVHQIMENHGGQITVKSEPSEGTTFRLVLPMSVERSS
jgi:signal transduction histidine kinase